MIHFLQFKLVFRNRTHSLLLTKLPLIMQVEYYQCLQFQDCKVITLHFMPDYIPVFRGYIEALGVRMHLLCPIFLKFFKKITISQNLSLFFPDTIMNLEETFLAKGIFTMYSPCIGSVRGLSGDMFQSRNLFMLNFLLFNESSGIF